MTKAPDKIWAFYAPDIEEDNPGCSIVAGERCMHGAREYTRSDLIPAMLAKARAEGRREGLREAERIARDGLKRCTANNHTYATGGQDDLLAQSVAQEIVVGDILVAILDMIYTTDT